VQYSGGTTLLPEGPSILVYCGCDIALTRSISQLKQLDSTSADTTLGSVHCAEISSRVFENQSPAMSKLQLANQISANQNAQITFHGCRVFAKSVSNNAKTSIGQSDRPRTQNAQNHLSKALMTRVPVSFELTPATLRRTGWTCATSETDQFSQYPKYGLHPISHATRVNLLSTELPFLGRSAALV
jgi:hypothetical protein